jgi:predicted negative regulator of RcsB-dependent stress response
MNRSDKEQIQMFKDWWKKYGNTIVFGIVIFFIANYGWKYWQKTQDLKVERASMTFLQMIDAESKQQKTEVTLFAKRLMQDYKKSPYASLAALVLAKDAVYAKDYPLALEHLNWVINHAKSSSLRQIARLRAARIANMLKKPEQALILLAKVDDNAFIAAINEVQGDSYTIAGDVNKATKAYQEAARTANPKVILPTLQAKLSQVEG